MYFYQKKTHSMNEKKAPAARALAKKQKQNVKHFCLHLKKHFMNEKKAPAARAMANKQIKLIKN